LNPNNGAFRTSQRDARRRSPDGQRAHFGVSCKDLRLVLASPSAMTAVASWPVGAVQA